MFLASIKSIVRELILFFEVSADTLKEKESEHLFYHTKPSQILTKDQNISKYTLSTPCF